jgi:hypothetical protein
MMMMMFCLLTAATDQYLCTGTNHTGPTTRRFNALRNPKSSRDFVSESEQAGHSPFGFTTGSNERAIKRDPMNRYR